MGNAYPTSGKRMLITASIMLAATMDTLDGTIANVALPQIQASVSASPEQIVWVLTSFLIATAIFTPLSAWLADRFGRRRIMLFAVTGFTLASLACGLSTDLYNLTLFRTLQGACGAALVPLSQAILLDINPPENHGSAMAIFGIGTMLGPVMGPLLGGWLTENLSWHWAFLINVPLGIIAFTGMVRYLPESREEKPARFDVMGFAALAIFLAALQLILDRGPQLDWFDSWEIRIEAAVMVVFLYVSIVHMFTVKNPFIRPAILTDRNFVFGSLISILLGLLVFAVIPLITTMLQHLWQYPVMLTGLVTAPRGAGTIVSMVLVSALIKKYDMRLILLFGLVLCAVGMYQMAYLSLESDSTMIIVTGILQGMSSGFIFVPLTVLVFSTLAPQHRNAGAALFALTRNIGASIGISCLQVITLHNSAAVHSRLTEGIRMDNPALHIHMPDFDPTDPLMLATVEHEISRQASMVGYIDSYWLLFIVTLVLMPLALFMRTSNNNHARRLVYD